MRGRTGLEPYRALFDLDHAGSSEVSVSYAGVSTLLIEDGHHALMTDGFFSRPGRFSVATRKLDSHSRRVRESLERLGISRLDAVMPGHAHFDHAMDAALVADLTGAELIGDESVANLGRGHGLTEDRLRVVTPGTVTSIGTFTVTHLASCHSTPDRYPGVIDVPLIPPARAHHYRCGQAWSIHISHDSGVTVLVHGSSGFEPGVLSRIQAGVVYLCVGELGDKDEGYLEEYWQETVVAVGARVAVMTHWDEMYRPADEPLRVPRSGEDPLRHTMATLSRLARRDHVHLAFPSTWQRQHPWRRANPR